ncbi:MAG: hypothetical protein SGI88_14910 [Candidatus Hydrogenedentes bacterium]|nr:hypothetical protein [Candidatus Hydrogenedentota bacterium]
MREENGNALVKWLLGCAVVVVLCIVGFGVLGYFGFRKISQQGAKELSGQVKTQYDALKAANKVPAEHAAVFDDLVAVSQDPAASMWTTMLVMLAAIEPLEDGAVSEEEAKNATTIRDFVKGNPDCSLIEFSQFSAAHPELQDMQRKMQSGMPTMMESAEPAPSEPVPVSEVGDEPAPSEAAPATP